MRRRILCGLSEVIRYGKARPYLVSCACNTVRYDFVHTLLVALLFDTSSRPLHPSASQTLRHNSLRNDPKSATQLGTTPDSNNPNDDCLSRPKLSPRIWPGPTVSFGDHLYKDHLSRDHPFENPLFKDYLFKYHLFRDRYLNDHLFKDRYSNDRLF